MLLQQRLYPGWRNKGTRQPLKAPGGSLDILDCGDMSPLSSGATRPAYPERPRAAALQAVSLYQASRVVCASVKIPLSTRTA
jgi:hypothetical protein